MDELKAGTVPSLQADTLGGRMDEAFRTLWASIHPDLELPTDPEVVNDRELMFAAIAQGLLRYLGDKRQQVATSTESIGGAPGTDHHHDVMFEWKP